MPHTERFIKSVYQQQEILDVIFKCNINIILNLCIFFESHDFVGCFTDINNIFNNDNCTIIISSIDIDFTINLVRIQISAIKDIKNVFYYTFIIRFMKLLINVKMKIYLIKYVKNCYFSLAV